MIITINEAEKRLELQLTKAKDFDLRFLTTFAWYKPAPKLEDVDKELHPLVKDMWASGYKTFNCCSGHGQRRGFIAFLPPRKRKLRAASWEADEPIPQSISDLKKVLLATISIPTSDNDLKEWLSLARSREREAVRA